MHLSFHREDSSSSYQKLSPSYRSTLRNRCHASILTEHIYHRSSLRFLISSPSTLSPPFYCKVCVGLFWFWWFVLSIYWFVFGGSVPDSSTPPRRRMGSIFYCCLLAEIGGCRLDLLRWFHKPERVRFR
ncbi:transmembrane protein, putative [Medicago truncatula]|uniref:Transmembrane protein, putative n=1 Tax=Medicago truncatula TaxID=3880 RepID=A0A072TFZ3_MEDTR|nr:transmembrane protein, putative [Medicago truncatula]